MVFAIVLLRDTSVEGARGCLLMSEVAVGVGLPDVLHLLLFPNIGCHWHWVCLTIVVADKFLINQMCSTITLSANIDTHHHGNNY